MCVHVSVCVCVCALTETYETQQGWERSLEGGMIDIETRQWARECHSGQESVTERKERGKEGGRGKETEIQYIREIGMERLGESKATISQMIPPPPLSGLLGCQWMPLLPEPPPPVREDQLARVSSPDTPSQCVCVCVCVCVLF